MSGIERETFNRILDELVESCGAVTALLVTKEGHNVAEGGATANINTTALAALVAGMFSATREVARLVGENQFSILLQQGEKRHIHISLVTDSTMMIIVFEDYKRIGIVRLKARQAGLRLAGMFEMDGVTEVVEEQEEISIPAFKEYALNIIDRIFES